MCSRSHGPPTRSLDAVVRLIRASTFRAVAVSAGQVCRLAGVADRRTHEPLDGATTCRASLSVWPSEHVGLATLPAPDNSGSHVRDRSYAMDFCELFTRSRPVGDGVPAIPPGGRTPTRCRFHRERESDAQHCESSPSRPCYSSREHVAPRWEALRPSCPLANDVHWRSTLH